MKVYRHGDIIFRVVDKLPDGKATAVGTRFERHGETGNVHTVADVEVIEVDWDSEWRTFIKTSKEGSTVTHLEHPELKLPPDTLFRVERVRSITPYLD